jgi:DNA invertase Pin-like site-specific DNA recombinase
MRAVLYTRVSTIEQAREGLSLSTQAAALRQYCIMRGFEVVAHLEDPGVSGTKRLEDRPAGRELVELLRGRRAKHVVAYKLDRLFRSAADCLTVTQTWERTGVALHLADLGGSAIDTSSAAGRMFLGVLATVAQFERDVLAERVSGVLQAKRARGEYTGGIPPIGYSVGADGMLSEHPDEQRALARMGELRDGGATIRAITATLNKEGYTARGKRWHKTLVGRCVAPAQNEVSTHVLTQNTRHPGRSDG